MSPHRDATIGPTTEQLQPSVLHEYTSPADLLNIYGVFNPLPASFSRVTA